MSEKKKIQVHENDDIRVSYDPNICEHAAECVKGLSKVFNPQQRPWIQVDKASADEIATVIDRCPTGALRYQRKGNAAAAASTQAEAVEVSLVSNGPLRIAGPVVIKDPDGNVILEASKMSLCRCGLSENKPFCDGSHLRAGWKE